ncbi:beta-propeller domain-containing protein [Verrucomicrobiota bacterium sgz303538]
MKLPTPRILVAVLGISISSILAVVPHSRAADEETEPVIKQVRGRAVTVVVPEGFQRIVLQQLISPRKGKAGRKAGAAAAPEWRTLATKFPNGEAATFTLRLAKLTAKRNLRVVGSRGDALPDTLLTDAVSFDPDPEGFQIGGAAPTSLGDPGIGGGNVSSNLVLSGNSTDGAGAPAVPREVVESDIWKVSGDRLYFFNQTRGLQIFDLENPDDPALEGTLRMPGSGDQMYLLGQEHAVLLTRKSYAWDYWWGGRYVVFSTAAGAVSGDSVVTLDRPNVTTLSLTASSNSIATAASSILPSQRSLQENEVVVVKTTPGALEVVGRVPYTGYLQESRLVGNVLYVVTQTYEKPAGGTNEVHGSKLISVDLSNPGNPVQRGSLFFPGWENTISATDRFFFVANSGNGGGYKAEVIDISSPDGAMTKCTPVNVEGVINDKFQLHLEGNTFTVVSQVWRDNPDTTTWRRTIPVTQVTNYSLANPNSPVKLGTVEFAPGETIRATRFDNGRAYVVTFVQQDPLWVVKVSDGVAPRVLGHVEVPGFSTYIEPLGDRLVTVGLVNGSTAVSLFDVADPSAPKVLSQVPLNDSGWTFSEATSNEKAFTVLPEENLVMLPFTSYLNDGYGSGVQLFDLLPDSIVKRGAIRHDFSPRRATVVHDRVVTISQTDLISVDATNRDQPKITADLEISWPVDRVILTGDYLMQIGAKNAGLAGSTLTISPANNPDASLATVDLEGQPVLDASVKDGILYVLQAPRYRWRYINGLTLNSVAVAQTDPVQSGLLTVFDVSKLPEVSKLGSTAFSTETGYGSVDGRLLWVNPTTLLWVQEESLRIGWPIAYVATTGLITDSFVPAIHGRTKRLFAFDVTSPVAPKLASKLQFGDVEPWDVENVIASNGSVFLGYRYQGWIVWVNGTGATDKAKRQDLPEGIDIEKLRNRHFLQVIDYGDPAAPFVHENRVNIPGQLLSVSNSGRLLFTLGQQYKPGSGKIGGAGTAIHVSAFDGTAAHLVDQLPLSQGWQPFLIADETIALLYPEPEYKWVASSNPANGGSYLLNASRSHLELWTLGVDGKLGKSDSFELNHETGLSAVRDLWVLDEYGKSLRLLDARNPEELVDLGSYSYEGWSVLNLQSADGDASRGLWLPLGTYGVEPILLTP